MDDVQVDLVDAKPFETARRRVRGFFVRGKELGRDEDLVARDAALADALPDALLVAVRLRGIDVSIAELERPANSVHAFAAVRHLPDAEPEQRDFVPVGEDARAPIRCHCRGRHVVLLASGSSVTKSMHAPD